MSAPKVSVPKTNYKQQLNQTLRGLQSTAGGYFDLNSQYSPKYTDLNLNTLHQTLFGDANAPGSLQTGAQGNTYSRGADIADVLRYGRSGYDALMQSNPGLAASLANANAQGAQIFAPGSLMTQLQGTARDQLALGGQLSPQEINALTQGTRAGFADRGMTMGNQSLGAELMARDAAMQQRLGQRIQWAQGVEGQAGQDRSYLSQLAGMNAGIYDPSQQVLGRGATSLASLGGGSGVGAGMLMGTLNTQNLFNPQQGQDAFNTNVNAQGSARIANANAQAATQAGYISGGATLLGTLASSAALLSPLLAASDERLKEDVRTLGKSPSGIPIKSFRYRGDRRRFVGAMAQDIEKVKPEAVVTMKTGVKAVRYPMIDADFYEVPTLGALRKAA